MTMLDRMRRHKGWLKWSLALVVLAFIVFYIPSFLNDPTAVGAGAAPTEVIAEVEGRSVTAGQFQQRYNSQIQAYRSAYGAGLSDQLLRQLGIEQQILQQMVDEQAALVEAERHGIRVSDEELAQQIFAIPGLQENGRFVGEQRYEQILRSQIPPMTKATFEETLRRSLMIDKLRAALTDWMTVSNADVEREFRQRNEKAKLQVVALTADAFRSQVNVSDADVSSYFDAHKAEYRVGEQRKVRMLLLDRDQAFARTGVTPTEVQSYYNGNITQYQTPEQVRASHILLNTAGKDEAAVRKQAEDILQQVKAGADFAELAKKYSEDEGSKPNGGDLDYFSRGRMVPEFEAAAFALEVGQVSDIVKSQFGFHIIKVVDKKPAVTRSLDEVRPQIEEQLKRQRADQQIATRSTELAAGISNTADLDRVARENGLMVTESEFFGRDDPVPGLGPAPQVAAAAFMLTGDAVNGPITTPRGPVFIALAGTRDPYVPTLDQVKDRVREDVIRTRATELSRQRASQIAAALRSASNFAAAAKAQGFEAKDTELIARGAPLPDVGVSAAVDKVAFSLPVGGVSEPITTNDATVIVRVAERDEVTPDELQNGRETFRDELLSERRGRFFSSYMAKAKERMRIEIRDDVVRRMLAATSTV
ncbi:MAG TPA: peptidyl-prolyl cis-trans isomerase [Vicinamibacterales bacterium]|nr:peptidyl-prolyl cis-trans isomerase [Vicinamibacterales bacterium]